MSDELRARLVSTALAWQEQFGVAPAITSALSEYDAALLVGCSVPDYCIAMQGRTAVHRGYDFVHGGLRYQVKANRPSGRSGSRVTLVAKPKNYAWDRLVWVLYDKHYVVQEAWEWEVSQFKAAFDAIKRLSPTHMRAGRALVRERIQEQVQADGPAFGLI